MVPHKDGGANEGHSCVKGRFAFGYASHPDRVLEPDGARLHRRRVARGLVGRGDRLRRPPVPARSRPSTASAPSAASPRRAAPTRRCTSSRRWCAPPSATTTSTPAPGSATRRPATASSRPSAPRPAPRTSSPSTTADVIVVIGANPTDGHPVFASRMKRRLREGAKLDRHRPAPHRPGAHPARRGRPPPAAAPRHQRRRRQRDGPRRRHRGPRRPRRSSPSAARATTSGPRSSPAPENSPEALEEITGVPAGRGARRRPALRRRAQRGDLLRPRRHRAQPGLHDGDGHGQPGHGHRQHRPRRRRRQPAARPEQRAGLVRHGLVPPRAARLPPRLRRRRPRHLRAAVGLARSSPSPACASPTCSTPPSTARSARMFVQGEDIAQSDPNTAHVHGGARGARPARRPGPVPQRDGASSRTCSCPARRSWRRTAPSPTPSGASTGCAR